jgi:hypothetical protein
MDTHFSFEKITDSDLCNTKYSIDVLAKHFHSLTTKVVLKTQDLTPEFCIKYILDTTIECGSKEHNACYTKTIILRHQKHISEEEFDKALLLNKFIKILSCFNNYIKLY